MARDHNNDALVSPAGGSRVTSDGVITLAPMGAARGGADTGDTGGHVGYIGSQLAIHQFTRS